MIVPWETLKAERPISHVISYSSRTQLSPRCSCQAGSYHLLECLEQWDASLSAELVPRALLWFGYGSFPRESHAVV